MKKVMMLVVAVATLMLTGCKKEFTITVQSNNSAWGSVTGGGTYAEGTVISIEAKANSGYQFVSWQDGNTSNPRSITVKSNETYKATFECILLFSVSETETVYFSPGNLQWCATGSHQVADGTAAGTWRFAPNQWDTIGAANNNIDSAYTGWIDLFGWGTSGYEEKYPYMSSGVETEYVLGPKDIAGTNYDWGVYNAIDNPQTNSTDAPGTWRTLTYDELNYLMETRTTTSGIRYAKATVNGVQGLVIVPDRWNTSVYTLNETNTINSTFASNIINGTDWDKIESFGCVFLPAAGNRVMNSTYSIGIQGSYWTTTTTSGHVYFLNFYANAVKIAYQSRMVGYSVRLVRSAE